MSRRKRSCTRKQIDENDYTQMPINGFLSSGKILTLKLEADLITLSACDTARGRTGDHDFAALPSALWLRAHVR
jgi:CHAT domain-containing protein